MYIRRSLSTYIYIYIHSVIYCVFMCLFSYLYLSNPKQEQRCYIYITAVLHFMFRGLGVDSPRGGATYVHYSGGRMFHGIEIFGGTRRFFVIRATWWHHSSMGLLLLAVWHHPSSGIRRMARIKIKTTCISRHILTYFTDGVPNRECRDR